jgi:DNA/RNA-binding domain of Phe-tRNA-synthetase-like protein
MVDIVFDSAIKVKLPSLSLGLIECNVKYEMSNKGLWSDIENYSNELREKYTPENVKFIPAIAATREAYKICGKDPTRYRPSAEQLHRRILQGKDLYQVSAIVDLINLVSLQTGYSIGGFDADKINGDLVYGIGREDEKYEAIGRGALNIAGMPVLRDSIGGIGTPTSDEMRTRVTETTSRFLMNINAFGGHDEMLEKAMQKSIEYLTKYAGANSFKVCYIKASE